MALSEESSGGIPATMLVGPTGYNNGGGFGGFGGDWAWIILLLLAFGGGWGMGGGFGGGDLYPWMNNSQNINDGFRDQMLNTNVASIGDKITSGFGDVATQLCGGFAGVNASISNATMTNLQSFNGLQSQLAQCCCDNRLATCQTQNLIASDGAATRIAIQEQTQAILDKMCQQEIDAYKRENDSLRTMVNMQSLAASQAAQTAALIADNTEQTKYIVNRVAPYPIPSYTVPNPFTPAAI
jgi:hypothetical protein